MRKVIWCAVMCGVVCAALPAFGEDSAQPPAAVYVVDMQRVINESLAGKAARSNLEAEVKKRGIAVEKSRAELEKLQADIDKQGSLLSPAAMEEKRAVFARKERDFSRLVQDTRAEIAKRNDAEMVKVLKEIDGVIAEVGAKGGRPFIIEKDPRLVVYANDRLDITADVVKTLNEKKVGL